MRSKRAKLFFPFIPYTWSFSHSYFKKKKKIKKSLGHKVTMSWARLYKDHIQQAPHQELSLKKKLFYYRNNTGEENKQMIHPQKKAWPVVCYRFAFPTHPKNLSCQFSLEEILKTNTLLQHLVDVTGQCCTCTLRRENMLAALTAWIVLIH